MGKAWYRMLPLCLGLCLVLCALPASAQESDYFQQDVQYEMRVSLDTDEKMHIHFVKQELIEEAKVNILMSN